MPDIRMPGGSPVALLRNRGLCCSPKSLISGFVGEGSI
jgi:hypothetical protein